ncbi:MAG: hypothetical protein K2I08_12125, partial [Muribaculaceae bacterium]|nr:hypothetical protein [Muribaculaceae bacterium]
MIKIKNIGTFLMMICVVSCLPFTLLGSISYTHVLNETDLNIYDVTAPDGTVFSRITGTDMFGEGEEGHPEIPYKVIRFLVPDNAYDFSVEIVEIEGVGTIELSHEIYPNQLPIPINDYTDDMFCYPNEIAYRETSGSFRAEVLEESRLEGKYHIIAVGLWPLAYNGNSDQLKFCKTMNISLAYKENGLFKQKKSDNKEGLINIADIVVNVDSNSNGLNSLEDYDFGGSVSITDLPIIPYYIISERALLPALEDLATWKTQKGYEVITKAIEDIYEDSRYKVGTNDIVDEAASLRKYLQDEYAEHGSFFCFLVGDHRTKMPIRKVVTFNSQTVVKNPNEKGYIPTDNYFSDLSEDGWPLFKEANGIYVAYYETSYVPYIYVGRLLCHSKEEISNYIKKLILYETNPGRGNSNYLNNAMIFVQQDGQYKYR